MKNSNKYIVSFELTPNEGYKCDLSEKLYLKTPLGNMLNPELSQKTLIQLHDMAYIIDEIRSISNNENPVTSTQTFDTDYGRLEIKIKSINIIFSLIHVCVLILLTAFIVFTLTYFIFK